MVGQAGSTNRTRMTARRPKRRRQKMTRLTRMLLTAAVTALAAVVLIAALHKLAKPYLLAYRESGDISSLHHRIAEAEKQNKELKGKIQYLNTDEGKISEARKLGWVKDGEVSVVVERPSVPDSTKAAPKLSPGQEALRNTGSRILRFFVRPHSKD